jgi:release factor glutamine methyltransferase
MVRIADVRKNASQRLQTAGIRDAQLDADLLIAHVLNLPRASMLARLDESLNDQQNAALQALIARRESREPLQHLLGAVEFYGRRFQVTPDVLIPRPDTETLIDAALERLPDAPHLLDVGTGSGAIAITLAAERPGATVSAMDISQAALDVAQANAEANGVSLTFTRGDLMQGITTRHPLDALVSNPPYIVDAEWDTLEPEVRDWDPPLALRCGADPYACYRPLIASASRCLRSGGWLLLEFGPAQAPAFQDLVAGKPLESSGLSGISSTIAEDFVDWTIIEDLAGNPRVLVSRRR